VVELSIALHPVFDSPVDRLIWDTGHGLDKVSIEIFAWATIIGSTVLTILLWLAGFWLKGAF